jgi:hypothetical protein
MVEDILGMLGEGKKGLLTITEGEIKMCFLFKGEVTGTCSARCLM